MASDRPRFYRTRPGSTRWTRSSISQSWIGCPAVEIVYGYASAKPAAVMAFLASEPRASFTPAGDGGVTDALKPSLLEARKKACPWCAPPGTGNRNHQSPEEDPRRLDGADNLNPQKARILVMLALAEAQVRRSSGCSETY